MFIRLFLLAGWAWSSVLPGSAQQTDPVDIGADTFNYDASIDPAKRHFPPGAFYPDRIEEVDVFVQNWYGRNLTALQEPRIYDMRGTDEVYRFTWLRTWGEPIAVRLTISDEVATLVWKRSDGMGGYRPGVLVDHGERKLTSKQVDDFRKALADIGFWSMSTRLEEHGKDGARWILEGKRPDRYHVVDRWSPEKDHPFARCCRMLLDHSALKSIGSRY